MLNTEKNKSEVTVRVFFYFLHSHQLVFFPTVIFQKQSLLKKQVPEKWEQMVSEL